MTRTDILPAERSSHAGVITCNNGSTHFGRGNVRSLLSGVEQCRRQWRHAVRHTDIAGIDDAEIVEDENKVCPVCLRPAWMHDHLPYRGVDGYPFMRAWCQTPKEREQMEYRRFIIWDPRIEKGGFQAAVPAALLDAFIRDPLNNVVQYPTGANAEWSVPDKLAAWVASCEPIAMDEE